MPELKDKNGEPIHVGDHVYARSRGGRHEGEVDKIVTTEEEAKEEGVKHPPKVRYISVWIQMMQSSEEGARQDRFEMSWADFFWF